MTEQTEVRIPKIGDAVKVVTSSYVETFGLVTAVHGTGYDHATGWVYPLINVVYVSPDTTKSDTYGRQIERDLCSLNHFNATKNMPKPGRYYDFI